MSEGSLTIRPKTVQETPQPPTLQKSQTEAHSWIQIIAITAILLLSGTLLLYFGPKLLPTGVNSLIVKIPGGILTLSAPVSFLVLCFKKQNTSDQEEPIVGQSTTKTPVTYVNREIGELEIGFLTKLAEDEEFNRLYQIIMLNVSGGLDGKIDAILDNYVPEGELTLTLGQKKNLKVFIKEQFGDYSMSREPLEKVARVIKIPAPNPRDPELSLTIYPTVADGSCGIYALIGKPSNRGYVCDATKARNQVIDWMCKWREEKNEFPVNIQNVLDDYFLHWKYAPSTLRNEKNEGMRNELYDQYKKLNDETQKDKLRQEFRDKIFESYKEHWSKTGSYLLQDELIAAAICFDIPFRLHQPGWGASKSRESMLCNPTGKEAEVEIWYNGRNHYERAKITS